MSPYGTNNGRICLRGGINMVNPVRYLGLKIINIKIQAWAELYQAQFKIGLALPAIYNFPGWVGLK